MRVHETVIIVLELPKFYLYLGPMSATNGTQQRGEELRATFESCLDIKDFSEEYVTFWSGLYICAQVILNWHKMRLILDFKIFIVGRFCSECDLISV